MSEFRIIDARYNEGRIAFTQNASFRDVYVRAEKIQADADAAMQASDVPDEIASFALGFADGLLAMIRKTGL